MRQQIVIGNWKMNKNVAESIRLVTGLKNRLSGKQDAEVVLAPSFQALHPVSIALQDLPFKLAAQDVCPKDNGAYTGEVSAQMVSEVGCTYVIVGHSERRHVFGETNAVIREKVKQALEHDLVPVICVGETESERHQAQAEKVVLSQLEEVVSGLDVVDGSDFVVAYEPVWAIGSGKQPTAAEIKEMHAAIRKQLLLLFPNKLADHVRIIYGGSVSPENVKMVMGVEEVDGLLVGGASLDPDQFAAIINYYEE